MNTRVSLILALLLGLISWTNGSIPPTISDVQDADTPGLLEFVPIISGVASPVGLTHAGDGSNRLFVVLQGGRIMVYSGGQLLATPFLDISTLVKTGGEGGLLGLAFHPDYATNGYFYVNYVRDFGGQLQTVVARYTVSANPNIADPASASIILIVNQDFSNHNGGQLAFGPDGYLYIALGDGGSSGDPNNRAQSPTSLLGKILRIDVNAGLPYAIPANNPFVSNPGVRGEIWAMGLRNPWRFSFDRLTGDMYIADVGQNEWEEVNFQAASSTGGQNYGWSCYEGTHVYNAARTCSTYGTLTFPAIEYAQGVNNTNGCSVTGGYVYRGNKYPSLIGNYLYGDFCTGKIWSAVNNGANWVSTLLADTNFLITSFGEDEQGGLYLTSYGTGEVYHIAASSFADVLPSSWAWRQIETLYSVGITTGCGTAPLRYCPANTVTRDQMAVFLMRGIERAGYTPPAVGDGTGFADVPVTHWAAAWIKQFAIEGITTGCGDGIYCPSSPVTRDQMAVFLLRVKYGASYTPTDVGTSTGFMDVPVTHWAAAWIKQLAAEGITTGCGGGNFCPSTPVSRDQMAVFLVRVFSLP